MPTAPPPPGLLTSTTGAPRLAASCGWMTRMAGSVGPPVANGTMNWSGRGGYGGALARGTLAGVPPATDVNAVGTRDQGRSILHSTRRQPQACSASLADASW